jgi:hypothetical protein
MPDSKTTFIGVLMMSCLLAGCGGSSAARPAPKPLPAEYRALAKLFALPMNAGPASGQSRKTCSELIAETQAQVMDLRQIHSSDDEINQVAALGAEAMEDVTKQIEALDVESMSKPQAGSPLAGAVIPLLAAIAADSPAPLLRAAPQLLNAQQQKHAADAAWKANIQSALAHIIDDSHKLEAGAMLLQKIAAKYSAPSVQNDGKLAMRFVEAWGPLGNDVLELMNAGPDLDDCTISVELTGVNGESHTDVHFVPKWPSKTRLVAAYSQGESVLGQTLNRTTVSHAQSVAVGVKSPRFSTQLFYTFNPQDQDKAVAEICGNLKIVGGYGKANHFLPAPRYIASLTMDGVRSLPKGQINLTVHQGTQSKSVQFPFASWKSGEAKSFPLPFDPESTDITVTFPDTGYRYETTLGR